MTPDEQIRADMKQARRQEQDEKLEREAEERKPGKDWDVNP
jgi:hypothetical protein